MWHPKNTIEIYALFHVTAHTPHGHRDLETEMVQWADSVKIWMNSDSKVNYST